MNVIYLIYFMCRLRTVYNLNYTPITLGYKVEEKFHLGICEQEMMNTTALGNATV
jgi:hypothetical protein